MALPLAILALFLPLIASLPLTAREVIASGTELRILPLGDSITWGWQSTHREGTNGYRYELGQRLAGSNYLFIGTQRSGNMTDNYNEGHPGYTINQIANVSGPALQQLPNVVLVHAGTNDLIPTAPADPATKAPARLGALVDDILKVNPDAVVLVAKIIQAADTGANGRIATFNDAVPGVVQVRVDNGFKVAVVDQSVIGADELEDGVHPTDSGYAHMGDIWFEALKSVAGENLITAPVGPDPVQS